MTTKCEVCFKRFENGDSARFVKIDGKAYIYCVNDTDALYDYCEGLMKRQRIKSLDDRAHYIQFEKRIFMVKANQYEDLVQYIKSLRQ